jgi:hypothetical protein
MAKPILKPLDRLTADYLKSQIETGQAGGTKKALQEICKLYRSGSFILSDQRSGMEQSIIGLLYTQRQDEKVRRWSLNALARIGRETTCIEAVKHTICDFSQEPQTMAAGIAAVYKLSRKPRSILKVIDFDPQMATLAALQHVPSRNLDLSSLPLNMDKASSDQLKLALIVVGLNRAPPHMLNPRHSNSEMVKSLGGHHDPTVSQYSVWAITENSQLGIGDLGIDIRDVELQPVNVRAWIFRLLGMRPGSAEQYWEYIDLGSTDPDVDARIGLATGLRETFFDGLEEITLQWFPYEDNPDVSQLLLDHMIRQAARCEHYEPLVLELYEKEPFRRRRMEANAAGTPLYAKMKRIDLDSQQDLFRGATHVTNNNISINSIQAGAVSVTGEAKNIGTTSNVYNPQTVELIQSELSKAERELHTATIDPNLKQQALEHVQSAKADPTPDKISKAVDILGKVESATSKTVAIGTALATIGTALRALVGGG